MIIIAKRRASHIVGETIYNEEIDPRYDKLRPLVWS